MRLYGKNPVIERIKANPKSIRKVYIQNGHEDAGYIYKKAKKWGLPVFPVPKTKMQKMTRSVNSQGLMVDIDDFLYTPYEELLERALSKKEVLVFFDGLTDPQNLGGIVRSLACLGSFSVVLPTHNSVNMKESVLRVACGGENYVKVAMVSNLSQAIIKAKKDGIIIAGTVVKGGDSLFETEFPFPLGLVIGSEGKGIRDVIKKRVDVAVTIPTLQQRLSYNVAHATTLLCYEILRQKSVKS